MPIVDKIKAFFPFLRGQRRLPPDLVRHLHPTRNPAATWKREGKDDLIVIYAPRPPLQGWKKVLLRFVGEPTGRRIELSDEIASYVWELCDGRRTMAEICRAVADKYQLGDRQTEVSVLQFMNMLRGRRLVGVPEAEQSAIDQASGRGKTDSMAASKSKTGQNSDGNSYGQSKRNRAKRARRY